jgi:hypothetical protein
MKNRIYLFGTSMCLPLKAVKEINFRSKTDCIVKDGKDHVFTVYAKTAKEIHSAVHRKRRQPS